jgi:hypothetical protein
MPTSRTESDMSVRTRFLANAGPIASFFLTVGLAITALPSLTLANPDIATTPVELIFSTVTGQPTAAEPLLVSNVGSAPLQISSLALLGVNPSHFQLVSPPSLPFSISAGGSATLDVRFAPTIVGALSAQLRIGSDDPDQPLLDVGLYGLSAQGLEGSNEPPLDRVVTTLGHDIDVGGTNLSLGTGAGAIGDEVLVPLFEKANAGTVSMIPVARYSPAFLLRFGFYRPNGSSPLRTEVGQLSSSSNPPEHQTLFPAIVGGGTVFDPGVQPFGVYCTSPSHTAYSQDSLNALLHPSNVVHAVRSYPLKDRDGVAIPNAYLVGVEEASNGDYQDYVFTLHNVRPAGTGTDGDGDGVIPPTDCDDTNSSVFPGAAELCDGLDNDCDATIDEGDPGAGAACSTGLSGECAAGTTACQAGGIVCTPDNAPTPETCNGIDDDCDGNIDQGNPGGGAACTTGLGGICEAGSLDCVGGMLACTPLSSAQPESCNGADDDCDGSVDEGDPDGGAGCATGQPGVCAAGTEHCVSAALVCIADNSPGTEICANDVDEDCDGPSDDIVDCQLCEPASTNESGIQTRRNKIKRKGGDGRHRVNVKGQYAMSIPGESDPGSDDITLHVEDEAGVYYAATLPAGIVERSKNGRRFSYKARDEPFVHDGLRRVKLAIRNDLVTVRYVFAAETLTLPEFAGATSRASVRLGTHCYTDTEDACTSNGAATAISCR